MNLIWIVGPPAVGKMTVGMALSERTGIPLLHNHMTIDLVLNFFPFGSPPYERLVESFRQQLFEEIAAHGENGLISTLAFRFDDERHWQILRERTAIFERHEFRVCWVELVCELDERLRRNRTALRLAHKPSKRDVAASERRLLKNLDKFTSSAENTPLPANWLRIDNTHLSADQAAQQIITRFNLSTL